MSVMVMPKWKVRMRQLAKRGYRSGRRVVARSPWTSEPDEALVALQGELGIGEEELWRA
jgi:hypothetical protein